MINAIAARFARFAALTALTVSTGSGYSQAGGFAINGRVKIEGGALDGTRLVVYKDGKKDRTLNSDLDHFSLDLDLNASYILSFEKDGFVTKKLSFDTHAPAEAIANGFTPFEFAVSLFKQYDDVNVVVFNQPVGMIRYEAEMDDFNYDTDYTKSIQSQLQEVLEQVAKKQEEEKKGEASAEKARQEEARAKAKAEAEAKKAAEEKAAADARAKKEQEAAAVKAEAERKKQEAANAKAEQERLAAEARRAGEDKRAQDAAAKAEQERQAQAARQAQEEERKAAAAKAEEERKAAALAKQQEEARRPPPPPVMKAERPPPPPPPAPRMEKSEVRADLTEGADERRQSTVMEGYEESRMKDATASAAEEDEPAVEEVPLEDLTRSEELIVEKNQVITVIRLETDTQKNEYRKVVHKFGATFYFKNGAAISRDIYETEALADRR